MNGTSTWGQIFTIRRGLGSPERRGWFGLGFEVDFMVRDGGEGSGGALVGVDDIQRSS